MTPAAPRVEGERRLQHAAVANWDEFRHAALVACAKDFDGIGAPGSTLPTAVLCARNGVAQGFAGVILCSGTAGRDMGRGRVACGASDEPDGRAAGVFFAWLTAGRASLFKVAAIIISPGSSTSGHWATDVGLRSSPESEPGFPSAITSRARPRRGS